MILSHLFGNVPSAKRNQSKNGSNNTTCNRCAIETRSVVVCRFHCKRVNDTEQVLGQTKTSYAPNLQNRKPKTASGHSNLIAQPKAQGAVAVGPARGQATWSCFALSVRKMTIACAVMTSEPSTTSPKFWRESSLMRSNCWSPGFVMVRSFLSIQA